MPPFVVLPDLTESYFNPAAIIAIIRNVDNEQTTIHLDEGIQLVTRLHPVQIMSGLRGGAWDVDPTQPLPPPARTSPSEPDPWDVLKAAGKAAFATFIDVANAGLDANLDFGAGPDVGEDPPGAPSVPADDAAPDDAADAPSDDASDAPSDDSADDAAGLEGA